MKLKHHSCSADERTATPLQLLHAQSREQNLL